MDEHVRVPVDVTADDPQLSFDAEADRYGHTQAGTGNREIGPGNLHFAELADGSTEIG